MDFFILLKNTNNIKTFSLNKRKLHFVKYTARYLNVLNRRMGLLKPLYCILLPSWLPFLWKHLVAWWKVVVYTFRSMFQSCNKPPLLCLTFPRVYVYFWPLIKALTSVTLSFLQFNLFSKVYKWRTMTSIF